MATSNKYHLTAEKQAVAHDLSRMI